MDFTNEIVKHVGTYRINMKTGWTGELNMVSWNGREPKLEIREWNPEHDKCGRGMTFTPDEGRRLYELMKEMYEEVEINAGTDYGEEDVSNNSKDSNADRESFGSE